jgi:hypothetical protein
MSAQDDTFVGWKTCSTKIDSSELFEKMFNSNGLFIGGLLNKRFKLLTNKT